MGQQFCLAYYTIPFILGSHDNDRLVYRGSLIHLRLWYDLIDRLKLNDREECSQDLEKSANTRYFITFNPCPCVCLRWSQLPHPIRCQSTPYSLAPRVIWLLRGCTKWCFIFWRYMPYWYPLCTYLSSIRKTRAPNHSKKHVTIHLVLSPWADRTSTSPSAIAMRYFNIISKRRFSSSGVLWKVIPSCTGRGARLSISRLLKISISS